MIDKVKQDKIPNHIAIIMDGNGRWAKNQGKDRSFGHKNGVNAVRNVIEASGEIGVGYLTLYTFSTENWNRPKLEIRTLMGLLVSSLRKELKQLQKNKVRLKAIGSLDHLPSLAKKELLQVIEKTKNNTGLTLTLALSYGSRDEIKNAVIEISKKVVNNSIQIEEIDEKIINNHLYTFTLPDVDLLIRTSGEKRISNFLLWQIAYAEFHFTDVLWPDFSKNNLYQAIIDFQSRERRYGKTGEQIKETND